MNITANLVKATPTFAVIEVTRDNRGEVTHFHTTIDRITGITIVHSEGQTGKTTLPIIPGDTTEDLEGLAIKAVIDWEGVEG